MPGTNLLTLRYAGRASSVDGTNVYEFRTGWDGLKLAHNTTYWVAVDSPGVRAAYPTKSLTTSDSQSSLGPANFSRKHWAIGNDHRIQNNNGTWNTLVRTDAMRMELRGDSEPYFPVSKPAAPGIMVSNLDRGTTSTHNITTSATRFAQSFTTGGRGKLRSLRLSSRFTSSPRVSIHSDNSGSPGGRLRELMNPSALSTTTRVHEFHAGKFDLGLRPNTTYWVVVENNGRFPLASDMDESGLTGWSIANDPYSRGSGSWSVVSSAGPVRMEILGFMDGDPSPPRHFLVSNLDKVGSGSLSISGTTTGLAQSFRTGGQATALGSVRLNSNLRSAPRVSIYSDSSGAPESRLRELLNPGSFIRRNNAVHEFRAGPAGLTLAANTTYWVVVEVRGTVPLTADTNESGAPGWSIGNGSSFRTSGGWSDLTSGSARIFKMEILPDTSATPPRVTGAPSIGTQGTDCVWWPGETVDVTLRFNEAVTVDTTDGTPSLTVELGGRDARSASYASGSGTRSLLFSYTMTAADGQNNSMRVPRFALRLNGGTIRNQSGTANADLRHRGAARGIPSSAPRGCQPEAGEAEWLVGNSTKGRGASDWTSGQRAQSFTTGAAATLKQALVFGSNWDSSSRVSVFSDSSGRPGIRLRTSRDHVHGGYGLYVTFDDLEMPANTTYWLVVEGAGVLKRLSNRGQDGPAGWSLGDRMQVRTGVAWRQHPSNGPMRIELLGAPFDVGDSLVSNLAKAGEGLVQVFFSAGGQSFRTGDDGRALRAVRLHGTFLNATVTVAIHADSAGAPGTELKVLTNPPHFPSRPADLEFQAGFQPLALAANTTYWVVVSGPGQVFTATDSGEDGLAGWSLGDSYFLRSGGSWSQFTHVTAMSMEILGAADSTPRVPGTPTVSDAGSDGEWTSDETVIVKLYFSEAVTVDTTGGSPTVGISLGGTAARSAPYIRGSGTTEVWFAYTLTAADGSHSSMAVTANSLALNGGTIRSAATSVDADLSHAGNTVTGPRSQNSGPKEPGKGGSDGANTPASGAPAIGGRAQVGRTLTADQSDIADHNGIAKATFAYQWLSRSGNTDSEVSGATGATYTLVDADRGKAMKVRVSFTDDSGNSEELTSEATAAVAPRPPLTASLESEPDSHDGNAAFTFEVHFTEEIYIGYKRLRDYVFTVTAGDVTGVRRLNPPSNTGWEVTVEPDGDGAVTIALPATQFCNQASAVCTQNRKKLSNSSTVTVPGPATQSQQAQVQNSPATGLPVITGTATVGETLSVSMADVSDANGLTGASHSYQWVADDLDIQGATGAAYTLADGDEGKAISVRVSFTDDDGFSENATSAATAAAAAVAAPAAANTPATGLPAISGTAQVGETLTVDTSAIADEDGLTGASYSYQWMAAGSDIDGATGSTHTLTASQQGQTIRVRVHFSDDSGNSETLTSAATVAVAARPVPLTAGFGNVPNSHDGNAAFTFELRFSEDFGLSYKTLRDHAFAVTGGEVIKARRLDPPSNVGWEITLQPDGDGTVTIALPITTDCAPAGAICTGDGRMLSNRLEVSVPRP